MRTTGVDMSTDPGSTAVAVVEWSSGAATLTGLILGCDDQRVLEAVALSDVAGIDCPFGWPDAFVDFISSHRNGRELPPGMAAVESRMAIVNRLTDLHVRRAHGQVALAVAADRIGLTALRCAGLLAALSSSGVNVDRAGSGRVAEVYPAASLRAWGLPHTQYKGTKPADADRRAELLHLLLGQAVWLDTGPFLPLLGRSDDALDALVAALTARAVALGKTGQAPEVSRAQAQREGWIHVPCCDLADLL